jgi:hydrogenase nickel incorporation protein HypA/HybF
MIDQIHEELEKHGGGTVEIIHLKIGVLSGVDGNALRSAYELASEGTDLERSVLEIETVSLLVYCPMCGITHAPSGLDVVCPHCVTPAQEILHGRELEVVSLEIAA